MASDEAKGGDAYLGSHDDFREPRRHLYELCNGDRSTQGIKTPADIWFFYAAGAIGVRILGAKLPDKVGPSNMVLPALGCYCVAYILIAQSATITDIWTAGLMAGLGHGYCFPVLTSQVVSRTPPTIRGSALAVFTALWEICSLGMTPVFGWISDHYGSQVMFSGGALLFTFLSVFWVISEHRANLRMGEFDARTADTDRTSVVN